MNYSLRNCAFVISALLIGVSAIDLNNPAEAGPSRYGYVEAWNQANTAISLCYEHENFEACNKLTRIKSTLMSWCSQNDRNSCTVYKNVISAEGIAQSLRVAREATR